MALVYFVGLLWYQRPGWWMVAVVSLAWLLVQPALGLYALSGTAWSRSTDIDIQSMPSPRAPGCRLPSRAALRF